MRLVFACDSFKGTMTSARTARLLEAAAGRAFPQAECASLSVADGGEGTVEAVLAALGGRSVSVPVDDPLGRLVAAGFGLLPNGTAVIEMASASGLPLLAARERDPRLTSTFGTGQLIRAALDAGARDIALTVGGSATNDGGMGCMRALGARFLDSAGRELRGVGQDLAHVASVDLSDLDSRIAQTRFHVMCDVDNPLVGDRGATRVFAPQKGADQAAVEELEAGMRSYSVVLQKTFGEPVANVAGMGAAGGLAAAARLFLGADVVRGVDWVLDTVGLPQALSGADLCITGEGHADGQSSHGKVVSGVAERCRVAGVPCIAIVGGMTSEAQDLLAYGVDALVPTVLDAGSLEDALAHAERNFSLAADRAFALVRVGMGLR